MNKYQIIGSLKYIKSKAEIIESQATLKESFIIKDQAEKQIIRINQMIEQLESDLNE